jgi:hypothetical protein
MALTEPAGTPWSGTKSLGANAMPTTSSIVRRVMVVLAGGLLAVGATALPAAGTATKTEAAAKPEWLKAIPYKIVYESYRENNWEIIQVNADGSDPVNLTKTPDVSEMYPHVSPDGSKIAFLVNAGRGEATRRSAWLMNYDGTGRTKIADDIRECCWNGDGRTIAMLPAESPKKYVHEDWATHGLTVYDLATGKTTPHPNKDLDHLLGLFWSPDSKWFLVTVYGGMGYSHTTLAFKAQSTNVFDLHISGCRPDLTLDGKHLAWGSSVTEISMADIDLSGEKPVLTNQRVFVHAPAGMKVYHVDWSPDGKYVAFSRGPEQSNMGAAPEQLGVTGPGWNLCVGNVATGECVQITTDGLSNKEPDWVPLKAPAGAARRSNIVRIAYRDSPTTLSHPISGAATFTSRVTSKTEFSNAFVRPLGLYMRIPRKFRSDEPLTRTPYGAAVGIVTRNSHRLAKVMWLQFSISVEIAAKPSARSSSV